MRSPMFTFRRACPVWEVGTEKDMNRHLCFTVKLPPHLESPVLSLAGSASFTVSLNGQFIAHGPARCAHGYYRVDQIALSKYLTDGESVLSIRVAGYYARSFSNLKQPSFLCAELTDGETVVAYTDAEEGGFSAYEVGERMRRVQRYSYQRPFVEHYHLAPGAFSYECGKGGKRVTLCRGEEKNFLVRTQPYGDYPVVLPKGEVAEGVVSFSDKETYFTDRAITGVRSGAVDGFPEEELEFYSYREVGKMDFCRTAEFFCRSAQAIALAANGYADIDLGCNYTGILDFSVETPGGCELFLLYDEFFGEDGSLNPFRSGTSNIFYYKLEGGKYHIHTCEPYTMRALRVVVRCGSATVRGLKMFKIGFPARLIELRPTGNDETMHRIFEAAVESFTANAADIYMDCPSRERAGWLCDSFFTARVEKALTGASRLERTFLENFLLPAAFDEKLPAGMLPMCYPSDSYGESYIPNWAMWYVLELEEYLGRTGDADMVADAHDRLYALLDWCRRYENGDGLLEKLPGWVFVEWSRANALVQDVNFPTNMLYAMMKDAMARLYHDEELAVEARAMREAIRHLSLTESGFFCDNLVYNEAGKLVPSGETTEACQYYAFYSGTATPESDAALWRTLTEEFGFDRTAKGLYPQVAPANAFIGNYLRLDLLSRYGMNERLLRDIRDYFGYMAEKTGTLWENQSSNASCNHGFASHVIVWMEKAGLLVRD